MSSPDFVIKKIIPVGTMVPVIKGVKKCEVEYDPTYDMKYRREASILLFQDTQTKKWHLRTESLGPDGHTFRLVDIHLNSKKLTTLRKIAFNRPLKVFQVLEPNTDARKRILKDLHKRYSDKINS
tara:strand:+ start:1194 stop:1568 length:375 start_codon:yes stop_codon:yes gene_type:complete